MTTSRFTTVDSATSSTPNNHEALKLLAWVGLPALGLASLGGLGIVGGGWAIGLAAEELFGIGVAAGLIARQAASKPASAHPLPDIDDSLLLDPTSTELDSLRRGDF